MRGSLWAGFLALALCFSMAWMDLRLSTLPAHARAEVSPSPAETDANAKETAPAAPSPAPQRLRVLDGGNILEMDMQDYLIGVVAAEMPADFEPEALKAQAVAARTYALYCARTGRHDNADVCTDFACCQAWQSEAAMRSDWGAEYETRHEKIAGAVEATDGEYLRFEGQAIFAAFHSSSAGYTENCGAIWSELPYLVSVMSPEDETNVPGYVSTRVLSPLDFRDTLLSLRPEADFSGPPESWLGDTALDESGRVERMELGGASFTGVELRQLFALRSTAFTLSYDGDFCFTVTGFGHGVGMSQYGANVMAADGASYREILAHYYPGTELCSA